MTTTQHQKSPAKPSDTKGTGQEDTGAAHVQVSKATSLLPPPPEDVDAVREPNRDHPRLAIYIRRSAHFDGGASLSVQHRRLTELVERLGGLHDPVRDLYEDDHASAKGRQFRPGVESLMSAIAGGNYDGVVIWQLASVTRNPRECHILTQLMRSGACDMYSHAEPWLSVFGAAGNLVHWATDLAADESARISTRAASRRPI